MRIPPLFAGFGAGLALSALAGAALAGAAAPQAGPGVTVEEVGVYCRPPTERREEAPDTALGYINIFDEAPEILFHQQEVPAALGISFGVIFTPDRDIGGATMRSYKPGATVPEVWHADYGAGITTSRGFTFEYPEELLTGLWRLEAWDEDTLLYAVEFDVMPPAALPDVMARCAPALS